jgi:phospholipid/cholesterol/gamma-HCH transport system substrate-binding protein
VAPVAAALDRPVGRKALGVLFLCVLAMSGWLTYAAFSKQLVDVVPVTVRTGRIGLQMEPLADVKIRGMVVGEVREMHARDGGAVLDLALDPDTVDQIPANVTALIVPKSIFGEKFVALQVPPQPSSASLSEHAVIEQTRIPIEVERALSDLYPLLRAVRPADLSATLNAMANALDGRGEQIGDSFVLLNRYLSRLNPQMPGVVENLRLLTRVSQSYATVMPRLGRLLRNQATTGNSLLEKEQQLTALFTDVGRFSDTARGFLEVNEDNIIRLGELSVPTLALLEHYAPQYPCLVKGIAAFIPRAQETYRGKVFHITLETIPHQPTGYTPADAPKYGAAEGMHRPDPTCTTLPDPPYSQASPAPMPPWADSRERDDGIGGSHGKYRPAPSFSGAGPVTSGWAGTAAEQHVVDALAAPVLEVPGKQVPDVATLLLGPLARGWRVSLETKDG